VGDAAAAVRRAARGGLAPALHRCAGRCPPRGSVLPWGGPAAEASLAAAAKQALGGDHDQKHFLVAEFRKVVFEGAVGQVLLATAMAPLGAMVKKRPDGLVRGRKHEFFLG